MIFKNKYSISILLCLFSLAVFAQDDAPKKELRRIIDKPEANSSNGNIEGIVTKPDGSQYRLIKKTDRKTEPVTNNNSPVNTTNSNSESEKLTKPIKINAPEKK